MAYIYEHVTLIRVIDGDTLDVAIDVGFRFQTVQRLRLLALNTPERGEPGYHESKAKLTNLLMHGAPGSIKVETVKQDSFGRWLSHVWIHGELAAGAMNLWLQEQPWYQGERDR